MKAVEFKTRIHKNRILIPEQAQLKLKASEDKNVRVIILIDEPEVCDEFVFQNMANEQFLNGYADSDSIYDKHE